MKTTVVYHGRSLAVDTTNSSADGLWIPIVDLEKVSGWQLKPEGVCKGEICMPMPPGREEEFVQNGEFNLAALAGMLGETVVHSEDLSVWVILESNSQAGGPTQSLEAPDFALPDLEGRIYRLSDYRGNKVFLVAWASW